MVLLSGREAEERMVGFRRYAGAESSAKLSSLKGHDMLFMGL